MKHYPFLKTVDLKRHSMRRHIMATGFLLVVLFISLQLLSQTPYKVSIPGTAFTVEGRGEGVSVQDVAGGRQFRTKSSAPIILKANLRMHPYSTADHKMQRLIVHFRTSTLGPSLQRVEMREGTTVKFKIDTHLEGDYTTRETVKPESSANVWVWPNPTSISPQSVIRLEVQFPGGFEGNSNPGEFILTTVDINFPAKPRDMSQTSKPATTNPATHPPGTSTGGTPTTSPTAAASTGVIYTLSANNDLIWYKHTGRGDGSFNWATPAGKTVGTGWNFPEIISGGGGVFYVITSDGDLWWYRHDGYNDGSWKWAAPQAKKIGSGWGDFQQVFSH